MPQRARRFPFETLAACVLAVAIFAFACGSSSLARVTQAGRPARWALLFVLLFVAVAWAVSERGRPRVPAAAGLIAAALAALALVSTAWSVDPRLTFERAVTFAVMLAIACLLAHASGGVAGGRDRLLLGIVAGATAVALAGLVVLAVRHSAAVQPATRDLPERYQGLGENPNTVPLLLAPCLALALWLLARTGSKPLRVVLASALLLFDGSMIASGSRGALLAAFAGVLVVLLLAPLPGRLRAVFVAATVVVLAVSILIALAPKSKGAAWRPPPAPPPVGAVSHPKPGYVDVQGPLPRDADIGVQLGQSKQVPRTLFGLTGRGEAWRGSIDLGNARPLLGYAFGTEARVFVDRWVDFVGGLPENSYIGMYLQLGVVGVVLLVALAVALVVAALRRPPRWEAAGPLAALVAALILGVVQSYLYSVGNIATLALWIAGFVAAGSAARERVPA